MAEATMISARAAGASVEPWRRLWLRTAIRGALLLAGYFALWELLETRALTPALLDLHALHLIRGTGAALFLATWSFLQIRESRLQSERAMQEQMKTLDERVRERTRELAALEARVRHQEKMASLGTMAAGFAHDIGNPLASISTELELLEGESDIAMYKESLGVLRRHVTRMSGTLREMVSFARRRRDEVTEVSVSSVVQDSVRLVRHDPRWSGVELVVLLPSTAPSVRMVEDHLVLVLVNLMLNAVDAMPGGGVLTISAQELGGNVEVAVRDTGTGMSPDVLGEAMTPHFTTKAGRGTGLGLAVSKEVIEAVGGTLQLESTPGRGTTARITLHSAGEDHG